MILQKYKIDVGIIEYSTYLFIILGTFLQLLNVNELITIISG